MTAFQKAEALASQRYDRDKLLALVHEVTTHFRMPNSFEGSKMRAVCRHLADALDRIHQPRSLRTLGAQPLEPLATHRWHPDPPRDYFQPAKQGSNKLTDPPQFLHSSLHHS
jgi:hypothetical protein